MEDYTKTNLPLQKHPVAIIGMSGLFAGAQNMDAFWENIVNQANCITEVPSSRWNIEEYYDPDPGKPDKTYSKVGGFIPDIDFDPLEYGLPPNILEVTDSSQILSLVMTKQALQDAGYEGNQFTEQLRKNTGVILGVGGGQKLMGPLSNRLQAPVWRKVLSQYGLSAETIEEVVEKMKSAYVPWQENAFPGFLSNVIAGRIANRFDLGGTNCVVDAACAASLSAIKMSINELVEHRCDMMISGGVDTDNSPMAYLSFSKTPAFSKKNQIRPFDKEADGIVIGEGIGMLVMKRLADAERDGDTIYAVIKGIGSSSDGRHSSIYGPVSQGQQMAMNRAYEEAGYAPSTVGLLEAHGTGTPTGDRVEFHSIASVFKNPEGAHQKIALGSVKSQIGHTKTAAGAASVIKASLALHYKVLPPTINVTQPNPDFNIEASPVYLNTQLRPWIQASTSSPRRAGVSAFGFGGTNFHLTLEEYQPEHQAPYRSWSPFRTAILHGHDEEALKQKLEQTLSEIQQSDLFEPLPVPSSIPQSHPRLGFVYQNKKDLIERLKTSLQLLQKNDLQKPFDLPQGISYSPHGLEQDSKIAVLFSGQGSQYVNMGSKLGCLYPEFRKNFQKADGIMQRLYGETLSDKVYPVPAFDETTRKEQQHTLTQTRFAQPAIGVMSMSMYKLLSATGLKPDMVGGHSFGELTALWAAGVLEEKDYLKLACIRGQVMHQAARGEDAGGMLAVQADVDTALRIIDEQELNLEVCNVNAPDQVVLGGSEYDVEKAAEVLSSYKLYAKVLPVSAAFHTGRLKEAQQPLAEAIEKTSFQNPELAVFSNINGQAYPREGALIQQKYKEHMLSTVQFQQEIEAMYQAGARIFIEVGPRNIMSNLVQSTLRNRTFRTIPLNTNPKQDSMQLYQQALTQLLVAGVSLNVDDPYQLSPRPREVSKPKMKVPFNASNYVSEKTRKQWEEALQDIHPISGSSSNLSPEPSFNKKQPMEPKQPNTVAPDRPAQASAPRAGIASTPTTEDQSVDLSLHMLQKQIDLMGEMMRFNLQQQEAMEKHRMFLENYKHQMNQMFAEERENLKNAWPPSQKNKVKVPELPEELTSYLPKSNGKHTTNGNGQLSSNGHHTSKEVTEMAVSREIAPPASDKRPVNGSDNKDNEDEDGAVIETAVLSLISDKTGYPAEMINLDMELVADLGIDSIKQVEIFGTMREQYPVLQQWQTKDFIQIKSLRDIVEKVRQHLDPSLQEISTKEPDKNIPATGLPTEEPMAAQKPADEISQDKGLNGSAPMVQQDESAVSGNKGSVSAQGVDPDSVAETLLALIADKTGYPAEMLSPEMELVADLGIDSIKQVEIFGALREQFPAFREFMPEQLFALKTVSDVKELLYGAE